MNRQNIVKKLVIEGFSEKTLVGLSDKQLITLSKRILKEQDDEDHKGIPHVKSGSQDELKLKNDKKSFVTYEEEMKEGDGSLPGLSVKGSPKPKGGKKSEVKKNDIEDNKPNEEETTEENEGGKKPTSKQDKFKEFLKKKKGKKTDKKVVNKKKSSNLAKDTKGEQTESDNVGIKAGVDWDKNMEENKNIKEWVDQLVQTEKNSITTKNEIMELINLKLQEQFAEPDIAEPVTKPKTPTKEPDKAPGKDPYHDPWKTPGIGPDPEPKMEKGGEGDSVGEELPDFLSFDSIISSVNEDKLNLIANTILEEIKNSTKPNINEVVSKILREIKKQ